MDKTAIFVLLLAAVLVEGQDEEDKQLLMALMENRQPMNEESQVRMQMLNRFREVQQGNWPNMQRPNQDSEGQTLIELPHNWPQQQMNQQRPPQEHLNQQRPPQEQLNQQRPPQEQLNQQRPPQEQMNQQRPLQEQLNQQRPPLEQMNQQRPLQEMMNQHRPPQEQMNQQRPLQEQMENADNLGKMNEIPQPLDTKPQSPFKQQEPELPQPLKGVATSIVVPLVPFHVDPVGNTARLPFTFQRDGRQAQLADNRRMVRPPQQRFPQQMQNDNRFEEQKRNANPHQPSPNFEQQRIHVPVFLPPNQRQRFNRQENFNNRPPFPLPFPPNNSPPPQDGRGIVNFENQNKNFDNQNKNFENQNKNFEDQNKHFENQNKHFEDQNKHFENQNKNFENQNKNFNNQDKHFNDQNKNFGEQNKFMDENRQNGNFKPENNFQPPMMPNQMRNNNVPMEQMLANSQILPENSNNQLPNRPPQQNEHEMLPPRPPNQQFPPQQSPENRFPPQPPPENRFPPQQPPDNRFPPRQQPDNRFQQQPQMGTTGQQNIPPPDIREQRFFEQNRPHFNNDRERNFDRHPNMIRSASAQPNFNQFPKEQMPLLEVPNALPPMMPNQQRPPFGFPTHPPRFPFPPMMGPPPPPPPPPMRLPPPMGPPMPPPRDIEVPKIFGDFPSEPKFDRSPWIPITPLPKIIRKPIASSSREALRVDNPPPGTLSTTAASTPAIIRVGHKLDGLSTTTLPSSLLRDTSFIFHPTPMPVASSSLAPIAIDLSDDKQSLQQIPQLNFINMDVENNQTRRNETFVTQPGRARRLQPFGEFYQTDGSESPTSPISVTTPSLQQPFNNIDATEPSSTPEQEMSPELRQISVEQLYRHWKSQFGTGTTNVEPPLVNTTTISPITPVILFTPSQANERLSSLDLRPSDWSRKTTSEIPPIDVAGYPTPQLQSPEPFTESYTTLMSGPDVFFRSTTEYQPDMTPSESVILPTTIVLEESSTSTSTTTRRKPTYGTRKGTVMIRRKVIRKKASKPQQYVTEYTSHST